MSTKLAIFVTPGSEVTEVVVDKAADIGTVMVVEEPEVEDQPLTVVEVDFGEDPKRISELEKIMNEQMDAINDGEGTDTGTEE